MGSYYTTVKVVNKEGKPVKAEVICGGNSKDFTNSDTGEISFDMYSNSSYSVSVRSSIYGSGSGTIKGGSSTTIRLS